MLAGPQLYNRKFLFDHLPKTGGTAFRRVLEQMFGSENVTPHIEGRSEIWAVQRFAAARLISGHFLSLIPADSRSFGRGRVTLLRHPVDRAISEYFYWRHHATEGGVADRLGEWAQRYDIGDFFKARADSEETGAVNFCTRHFASRISRNLGSDERTLALAMKSLKSYDFIGIYEHLRDSVDLFCWEFRLPPVDDIPRVNVTSSRIRMGDLDSRTFDRLMAMNDQDMQLYDYALHAFEARRLRIFRELLAERSRGKASEQPRDETVGRLPDEAEVRPVPDHPSSPRSIRKHESFGSGEVEIVAAQVLGFESGNHEVAPGEEVFLCVSISAHANVPNLTVGFDVSDAFGEVVYGTNTWLRRASKSVRAGCDYDVVFRFKANLNRGRYSVGTALHTGASHTDNCFHWRDHVTEFDVVQLGEPDFIGYCRLEPEIEWWDRAVPTEPSVEGSIAGTGVD